MARRAYLVRHGQAALGPDDAARPLTAHGRTEVGAVARALADRGVEVAEIRHSGLERARQTADLLAGAIESPGGVHPMEGLAPEDDPQVARDAIEAARQPLMLVGHLPHLGRLAALLVGGAPVPELRAFPPGAVVCLAETRATWVVEWTMVPPSADLPGA